LSNTYEFLEVFKLAHVGLEDGDGARPVVGQNLANVLIFFGLLLDVLVVVVVVLRFGCG
jgi:hypothetical protein